MNLTAFESIAERIDERPRCLACGTLIDAVPEAETFRRRGAFALVVQWRICACGAFARTQRVRKAAGAAGAAAATAAEAATVAEATAVGA